MISSTRFFVFSNFYSHTFDTSPVLDFDTISPLVGIDPLLHALSHPKIGISFLSIWMTLALFYVFPHSPTGNNQFSQLHSFVFDF